MSDKPCRHDMDGDGLHCTHPLLFHFHGDHPSIYRTHHGEMCHGCPCHEPAEPAFHSADEVFKHYGVEPENCCPNCGGPADNGFDRCMPPNPYYCTKCNAEPGTRTDPPKVHDRP